MKQIILKENDLVILNDKFNEAINQVKPENIFSIGNIFFDGTEYIQSIIYLG